MLAGRTDVPALDLNFPLAESRDLPYEWKKETDGADGSVKHTHSENVIALRTTSWNFQTLRSPHDPRLVSPVRI